VPDAANLQLTWNSHLDFQTNALNLRVRLAADLPDGETPDSFAPVVLLKNDPDSFQIEEAVASAQQQSAAGLASSYHVAKTLKDAASTQEEVRLQAHLIYAVTNLVNHFQDNTDPARTLTKLLDKVNLSSGGRDIFSFTAELMIDAVTRKITLGDFQGIYEIQEYFASPADGTLKAIQESLNSISFVQAQIQGWLDNDLVLNLTWDGRNVSVQKKDIYLIEAAFHFLRFALQYFSAHNFDIQDQVIEDALNARVFANTVTNLKELVERYSDLQTPLNERGAVEAIPMVELLTRDPNLLTLRQSSLLQDAVSSLSMVLEAGLMFIEAIEKLNGGSTISAFYVDQEDMDNLLENKKMFLSLWNNLNQQYHPHITIDGLGGNQWYSVSAPSGETLIQDFDSTIDTFSGFDLGYMYGYEQGIDYQWNPNTFQSEVIKFDRLSFTRVELSEFFSKSFRDLLLDEGSIDPSSMNTDDDLLDAHVQGISPSNVIDKILPGVKLIRNPSDSKKVFALTQQVKVSRGSSHIQTVLIPLNMITLRNYSDFSSENLADVWIPFQVEVYLRGRGGEGFKIDTTSGPTSIGVTYASIFEDLNYTLHIKRNLIDGVKYYSCYPNQWQGQIVSECYERHPSSPTPEIISVLNFNTRSESTLIPQTGGGTLTSPATLQIGSGASLSLSRIGRTANALARITTADNPTYSIYSFDGDLLEGPSTVSAFPVSIELTGAKNTNAAKHGVLVACLNSAGKAYRTIFKLSSADLASNGPILENGGIRTEDIDGASTVVAALIESEMTNQLGVPVKTCKQLSGATKAAIDNATSTSNTSGIGVDDLAAATKAASKVVGSLVADVLNIAASNTTSTTQITSFIRTGRNASGVVASAAYVAKLNRVRGLIRAATKLSRQARAIGTITVANVNNFVTELIQASDANATANTAGAEAVANALEIQNSSAASGLTTLNTAIDATVGNLLSNTANLGTAASTIAEQILDDIGAGEAQTLDSGNELDALAGLIGAGLAGSASGSAAAKNAEAALNVGLGSATDPARLLGKALEASSSNTAALQKVVNTGRGKGVNISDAVNKAGRGHKNTVAQVVEDSFNDITISDAVFVVGPKRGQAADKIFLQADALETQAGTYTYEWALGGAGTLAASGNDFIVFTAGSTGNYTITLTQKYGGNTQSTASHSFSILVQDAPEILMSETSIVLRRGGAGFLQYLAIDNAGAASSSIVVGSGTGCATPVAGLTAALATGRIDFAATFAVAASPSYCAIVTATPSAGGSSVTQLIDIEVLGVTPTSVNVNPVGDQTAGDSLTITAFAQHDSAATGTLTLTVTGPGSGSNTASLSGGSTSVSTTLANLAVGTYTVTATVGTASDSTVFTVNAAGAPTGLSVQVDGITVGSGDSLSRAASGSTATVDIDVSATGADTYRAWSGQASDSNSTGQNLSLALPVGTNMVTVSATNSSGVTAQAVFDVVVTQVRNVWVSHVIVKGSGTLATADATSMTPGTGQSALTTSYANGVYMVDATNVVGLDLNTVQGDALWFNIYTETPSSADVSGLFDIEITMTQANSIRFATLAVSDATIVATGGGWDVVGFSSLFYTLRGENGTTGQVQVSSMAIFDALFEPVTNGLKINLLQVRDALQTVVTDSGLTEFISSYRDFSGSGITLEISITSGNFSFTTGVGGADRFNSFKIWNITVN
jgi:hypothetical protein